MNKSTVATAKLSSRLYKPTETITTGAFQAGWERFPHRNPSCTASFCHVNAARFEREDSSHPAAGAARCGCDDDNDEGDINSDATCYVSPCPPPLPPTSTPTQPLLATRRRGTCRRNRLDFDRVGPVHHAEH